MHTPLFSSILREMVVPDSEATGELVSLAGKYPWCSGLHVLVAAGYSTRQLLGASEKIALASVYMPDRAKLYRFTTPPQVEPHLAKAAAATAQVAAGARAGQEATADTRPEIAAVEVTPGPQALQVAELTNPPSEPEATDPEVVGLSANEGAKPGDLVDAEIWRAAAQQLGSVAVDSLLTTDSGLAPVHAESTEPEPDAADETPEAPDTFGRWLMKVSMHTEPNTAAPVPTETGIIEKFIQESPQISPVKRAFFSPAEAGKRSLQEDEWLVTETLARIYEQQGDYKRAARAYKNLGLKYPEKSLYFAALQKQAEEKTK
jgi:hypothetical protein